MVSIRNHKAAPTTPTSSRSSAAYACYLCYLLASSTHPQRTYVGITNNFHRRLRQHNGELVGGARATRVARPWHPYISVEGFPDQKSSLQFEWMWKHMAPKKSHGKKARITKLRDLLQKEQWTAKSPLANTIPLTVTIYDYQQQQHEIYEDVDRCSPLENTYCWEVDLLTKAAGGDTNTTTFLPDYVQVKHILVSAGDRKANETENNKD